MDFDEAFKKLTLEEQQRATADQFCFGQAMLFIAKDGTVKHIPPEDWAAYVES